MKLGTARIDGVRVPGMAVGSEVRFQPLADLYAAADLGTAPPTIRQLIEGGPEELARASQAHAHGQERAEALDPVEGAFTWAPPIPDAGKVIGVAMNNGALNIGAHVEPDGPMFFLKPTSSLVGDGHHIEIGPDYGFTFPELELGVVIGTPARHVSTADALDHVFGYSIINDVTSQGLKKGDSIAVDLAPGRKDGPGFDSYFSWRRVRDDDDNEVYFTYHARSKGADTFGPMGPWITTADEIANPDELAIRGFADGELFANDNTSSYSYSIATIISHASRYFTLEPGDIFSCGTAAKGTEAFPRGHHDVDMSISTPEVSIEIDGLGRLSNRVTHVEAR